MATQPLLMSGNVEENPEPGGDNQTALPSMRDLIHAVVSKIPFKWRAVGTELKMPTGTLDKIQEHNAQKSDKDSVSFEHMLCIWMQQDLLRPCPKVQPFGPFTWRSIIDALRTVGEVDLADTLKNKHLHPGNSIKGGFRTSGTCNIVVVGRTGDGKSTLCHYLAVRLDMPSKNDTTFQTSSGANAFTNKTTDWKDKSSTFRVVDTPGLLDTGGIKKDEENIKNIVQYVAGIEYVNGFYLVVNEQSPRFDDGMQNAVKLLVDSFGPAFLNNFGIVFTRAYGKVNQEKFKLKVDDIVQLIRERTGTNISHLHTWRVGLWPEELDTKNVPDEASGISRMDITGWNQTMDDILKWACSMEPVDTRGSVIGEYELRKRAREEGEKRLAAEAKGIYESSVIYEYIESRITEYNRSSVPHIQSINKVREVWDGNMGRWLGIKKDVHYTEQVHVGNTVTKCMREEQRTVKTLGSHQIIYEDWKTVREWSDVKYEPR